VHHGADRNLVERQRVARLDVRFRTRHHRVANFEIVGRDDVALGAVDIMDQRDARGAVRVVLDRDDLGRHAVLLALEVDGAIELLVAAAFAARGQTTHVVATTGLAERLEQRFLGRRCRELREIRHRAIAQRRRDRFELFDAHRCLFSELL
jgi:hypothetical protein